MVPIVSLIMKVICAGLSKTGTKTMTCALRDLGYNVYDFMENFTYLGDEWRKILTTGGTTEDFRRMFENVDAVSDLPGAYYWDEIHKAFPDSKVSTFAIIIELYLYIRWLRSFISECFNFQIVLMMRENEVVWYKSLMNQVKAGQNFIFRLMPYISIAGWQFTSYTALMGERIYF